MTRDTIIDLADRWSEKKGTQFNLQKLYELACQNICKQNRFWWRKKWITFNLVIGTATYDLTSITTTPTLTETGIEEIIRFALLPAGATSYVDLTPIFDDDGVFSMLEASTNIQPSRYIMGVDALQTLRVDPPDAAYKCRLSFWAMPNFADDSSSTTVPLIPDWHHNAIAEAMAAEILETVYGQQDAKAATMRARYQASLLDMQMRPRYTTDYKQSFTTQDNQDAVQST